ncbi:hypothetical protein CC78DRAFT_315446 [Lojkania enalia]|uniref:C2H2-type domain-containing protein n=1 Tax=Lojkania enalia TaxID=147567 RepID=A0A9P4N1M6_9PLEO|nr:hypothetical protein CC78DRAFT_315446 [Didymosphaeria enalia]
MMDRALRKDKKKPPEDNERRKLACPYYKRNPVRYRNMRPCSRPGWHSCYRLKEHLYRRQLLSEHVCLRCKASFQTRVELHSHAMMIESCTPKKTPPDEGLRQRPRETAAHQTAVDSHRRRELERDLSHSVPGQ